jgi:hypothetical protein
MAVRVMTPVWAHKVCFPVNGSDGLHPDMSGSPSGGGPGWPRRSVPNRLPGEPRKIPSPRPDARCPGCAPCLGGPGPAGELHTQVRGVRGTFHQAGRDFAPGTVGQKKLRQTHQDRSLNRISSSYSSKTGPRRSEGSSDSRPRPWAGRRKDARPHFGAPPRD